MNILTGNVFTSARFFRIGQENDASCVVHIERSRARYEISTTVSNREGEQNAKHGKEYKGYIASKVI